VATCTKNTSFFVQHSDIGKLNIVLYNKCREKLSTLIFFEENNINLAGSAANPHLRNKKFTDIMKEEMNANRIKYCKNRRGSR